jgi:hypothetical protein
MAEPNGGCVGSVPLTSMRQNSSSTVIYLINFTISTCTLNGQVAAGICLKGGLVQILQKFGGLGDQFVMWI